MSGPLDLSVAEKRLLDRWIQEIGAAKAITKLLLMRRMHQLDITPVWQLPAGLDEIDLDAWYTPARLPDPILTPELDKMLREIAMRD